MTPTPRTDVQPRLSRLVDQLTAAHAIRSPQWAGAFQRVPRHVFVPRWFEQTTNERGIAVWNERDHADEEKWLAAVYSDTTLVTALDPATAKRVAERAWTGVATSSSTQPSLMAGMLEELRVDNGNRILEIGTGTGYNAALLSARLGHRLVHTVDINTTLVTAARAALAHLGHEPTLLTADGRTGAPGHAPYDRIIATCSVPRIPTPWIEQLAPGGLLVTDLNLGIEGGLTRFQTHPDGHLTGVFTETAGRFMPARTAARSYEQRHRTPYAPEAQTRPTTLTAAGIRGDYPFRLLLAFTLPGAELVYHRDSEDALSLQLQTPDGSWARTPLTGPATVTYGGDPELWHQAEAAWDWWTHQPTTDQTAFSLTRHPDGHMEAHHLPSGRHWHLGT